MARGVYHFPASLREAVFIARLNRFLAEVEISGVRELAHIPHTGRLHELLVYGRRCFLAPAMHPEKRKTRWMLTLIENSEGVLGCIDTSVPNKLIRLMAQNADIPGLKGWKYAKHEIKTLDSRLDLMLENARGEKMIVEVKSVTWVIDGHALFPDAPTSRGLKHLQNLIYTKSKGNKAMMIFVIQREDAKELRIADFVHRKYLEFMKRAKKSGVSFLAVKCKVTPKFIEVIKKIPIQLKPPPRKVLMKVES